MPRQFSYRGHSFDELQQMSMDEFIRILPSRQRRSLTRGLTADQRILMELIRGSSRGKSKDAKPIRTHCRDMVILPEMVGLNLLIHSGKEFESIDVKPEMIGHYLGEFVITNKKVLHGTPGIGASRSSMYVPLK
ncbi:MAG: 30S ribosomal protein S19 [Candidatus Bathyarchaeia archaeon]|nr:30S ribosomal protein S19 [Candidatus Bathyarchaeia archaeon]